MHLGRWKRYRSDMAILAELWAKHFGLPTLLLKGSSKPANFEVVFMPEAKRRDCQGVALISLSAGFVLRLG